MKAKRVKPPPNLAAQALGNEKFRQRVVKDKKGYSRKEKHKKGEGQNDGLPSFLYLQFPPHERGGLLSASDRLHAHPSRRPSASSG